MVGPHRWGPGEPTAHDATPIGRYPNRARGRPRGCRRVGGRPAAHDRRTRGRCELQRRLAQGSDTLGGQGDAGLRLALDHHHVHGSVQGSCRLPTLADGSRRPRSRDISDDPLRHELRRRCDLFEDVEAAGGNLGLPLRGDERHRLGQAFGRPEEGDACTGRDHRSNPEADAKAHPQTDPQANAEANASTHTSTDA